MVELCLRADVHLRCVVVVADIVAWAGVAEQASHQPLVGFLGKSSIPAVVSAIRPPRAVSGCQSHDKTLSQSEELT